MKETAAEKREYTRLLTTLKVLYTLEGNISRGVKEASSRNISESGILISVPEALPISTVLDLNISSPQLDHAIKTKGRVVWIQEIKQARLYDLGIAFTKILNDDAIFIKNRIHSLGLDRILAFAVKSNASDIHLLVGQPAIMRVNGEIKPLEAKALSSEEVKGLIYGFLSQSQQEKFERDLELDTSYTNNLGRFRVNIHQERGQLGAAFRYLPTDIRGIKELGLPVVVEGLARKPNGLILITGPTGSGKSTTMAAMIDIINKERKCMIISLEDPIEYLHTSKKSIIRQREVGFDTHSFAEALKHTLRQDVNVILVGEIRDLDSIAIALTAAETGHLVLTTLHTIDASSSINRVIDVFPAEQQQQVKLQLANSLRGIVSQILLPTVDGKGRVLATEILICTNAITNLIRQGDSKQVYSFMTTGTSYGMHTLDSSLERLYQEGRISRQTVLLYARDPVSFAARF